MCENPDPNLWEKNHDSHFRKNHAALVLSVHIDFMFYIHVHVYIHTNANIRFGQIDHLCVYSCTCCMFNAPFDKSLSGQQGQGSGHLLYLPVGL